MKSQKYLKKESPVRRFINIFSDFFKLSGNEIVYTLILVTLLLFFFTICFVKVEYDQSPMTITVYYGFPFETLKKIYGFQNGAIVFHGYVENVTFMAIKANEVTWFGLVINLALYTPLSIFIVKILIKVREVIFYYRYEKR
jgi:hypothetical protein